MSQLSDLQYPFDARGASSAVINVGTLVAFRALIPAAAAAVILSGTAVINDGGGGVYVWNASSVTADDGVNTIAPNSSSGVGRWTRILGVTGSLAGDVTGTLGASLVSKVQGVAVPGLAPQAGQFFKASSPTSLSYAFLVQADIPNPAGDVTGTYAATLVSTIRGVTTPSSPTANQFLVASSTTALQYRGLVAADLPLATASAVGAVQLAGDFGGSATAPVTARLNGITAPASAPSTGQFLVASSATALTYRTIASSDLPALAGDVTGAPNTNTVVGLTGTANVVAMHGTTFQWDAGVASPTFTQAISTTGAGQSLYVNPQAAKVGSAAAGGNLVLKMAAGDGAGAAGIVQFQTPTGVLVGSLSPTTGYCLFTATSVCGGINFDATANANGQLLFATGATGSMYLSSPTFYFRDGAYVTTLTASLLNAGATSLTVAATVTSFTISQANSAANSATGATSKLQAQNMTGTGTHGGSVIVTSGTGTTGHGVVALQVGGVDVARANPNSDLTNLGFMLYAPVQWNAMAPNLGIIGPLAMSSATTLSAAQYNNHVLLLNPSAAVTVTFPNSVGEWLVVNLSGSFAITCTAGTGATNALVPAAGRKWVVCDGSNNMYANT